VIHPFLLSSFPILRLFAQNGSELPYHELMAPLAVAFGLSSLVWLAMTLVLRNSRKAGLFTTLCLIPVLMGSRFPQFLDSSLTELSFYWVSTDVHVPPRVAMLGGLGIFALCALVITFLIQRPAPWTKALNIFSIILVLLPLAELIRSKPMPGMSTPWVPAPLALGAKPEPLPDIYYIILDGYGRSDVLREMFDMDNSAFLDELQEKGFYVAHRSTANYCQTPLSLSSSLNLDTLDHLIQRPDKDVTRLRDLIGNNNLIATLQPLGYKFVSFATSFEPTEVLGADAYLSPRVHFTEFHRHLIDQTCLWALLPDADGVDLFTQTRERLLFTLDRLPSVAADPQPTMTFAHLLCPHPPFLFGPDGEDVSHRDDRYYQNDGTRYQGFAFEKWVYVRAYREQAIYVTRRIKEIIGRILANSPRPPIIVLQSDHGPGSRLDPESSKKTDLRERMSILNAYYFPDRKYQGLYPEITPVNSFRVILNTFFGARLDLVPDRNYFSTWSEPFRFEDVTEMTNLAARDIAGRGVPAAKGAGH
jgi:hypothetical protein